MNANHFQKAFELAAWEQLHGSLMGVRVNADSTFSRGMGLRERRAPARCSSRGWGDAKEEGRRPAERQPYPPGGERMRKSLEEALNS